ncbi:BnaC09g43270D [Brassica napus]|uniref:BnaC09g43270D protein n=2 Tax=Brassica napus TaxID=3708 RepID=A0A078FA03_BRANA|nr:BnaC09g43270D [Brassica napus]
MLPARCGEHLKYIFVSILCLMQDLEDLLTWTKAPPLATPFLSPFG